MSNYNPEKERAKKREAYLLAAKNPWLVWRLQAFREGHTPPLLVGHLPEEYNRIKYKATEEYSADTLVEHAKTVRKRERVFLRRMVLVLLVGFLLFAAGSFTLAFKEGSNFK